MKKTVVFLLFPLLFSCGSTQEKKPIETENEYQKCKTLLLIAEDRSGSSQGSRKLTLEDYQALGEHFVENYIGQFVVRTIGNPSPEQRDFFTFSVKGMLNEYKTNSLILCPPHLAPYPRPTQTDTHAKTK